jgi:hypothetical protein
MSALGKKTVLPAEPLLRPWTPSRLPYTDVHVSIGNAARYTAEVGELAAGIEAVLELVHLDELEAQEGDGQPLFDAHMRERLLRLAMLTARGMVGSAEHHLEWLRKRAADAGVQPRD